MVLLKRFVFIIRLLVTTYKEITNEIIAESVEHVEQGRLVAVSPLLLSFIRILALWTYLLSFSTFQNICGYLWYKIGCT